MPTDEQTPEVSEAYDDGYEEGRVDAYDGGYEEGEYAGFFRGEKEGIERGRAEERAAAEARFAAEAKSGQFMYDWGSRNERERIAAHLRAEIAKFPEHPTIIEQYECAALVDTLAWVADRSEK